MKSRTTYDELGRTVLTEHSEDGSSYTISSRMEYEQMGRITLAANPRRASAATTDGWTRTTRNNLGRITEVATFSGAARPAASGNDPSTWTGSVTTSYQANETTVTEQDNKSRRSITDALGRLSQIIEARVADLT